MVSDRSDRSPERWRLVESIFHAALEREPADRDAFVRSRCRDDEELRREIMELLEADERGERLLETASLVDKPAIDPGTAARRLESAEDAVGQRVGAYRITRLIGAGGMGAVYLSHRVDGEFRMRVALKLIKRGMDTDEILRRFRNERQVLANLDHPNIARLLDGGTTDDGRPFLVMEYVDGLPIDAYCDRKRLSIADRVALLTKVCAAVDAAHQMHVVHRDLKPANILVTEAGEPKLLDFGIAKLLKPDLAAYTTAVTQEGALVLTPRYASPEQVRGEATTVTSDVYTLGVILYELLTGSRPFSESADYQAMRQAICEEEPPLPSRAVSATTTGISSEDTAAIGQMRSTRASRLRRTLSGDLDVITMRTLHKQPDRRYASAAALADDLSRYLAGEPIRARRDSVLYRGRKYLRRHRAAFAAAALAVLAMLLTLGILRPSGSGIDATGGRLGVAVLPLGNATGDPTQRYLADGMTEALIATLGAIDGLRVTSRTSAMAYRDSPKRLSVIAEELGVDYVIEGSMYCDEQRVRVDTRLIDSASDSLVHSARFEDPLRDVMSLQARIARRIAQRVNIELSSEIEARLASGRRVDPEAYRLNLQARFAGQERTRESLERAVRLFERSIELDAEFAEPHAGLAEAYALLADYGYWSAERAMPLSLEEARRALALDPTLVQAHSLMGRIATLWEYDWSAAERSYEEALRLNPSDGGAHKDYGVLLSQLGRFAEARRHMRLALEVDPVAPIMHVAAGVPEYYAGEYEESMRCCRRALAMEPSFDVARWGLMRSLAETGSYDEAVRESELVVEPGFLHLATLAYVHARAGEPVEARALLERISRFPAVDPFYLACVHAALGDVELAIARLEDAVQVRSTAIASLRTHPMLRDLRVDPRFERLANEVRLPPLEGGT